MSNKNKYALLVLGIVIFLGVGIFTAFNINSSTQNNTIVAVTGGAGGERGEIYSFPVSQAPNLGYAIHQNKDPHVWGYLVGEMLLTKDDCIYIMSTAINMINCGKTGNIAVRSFGPPKNQSGNITQAKISKNQYLDIANRTSVWMDNYGSTPNYVGISDPEQHDLSRDTMLTLFSKVLSDYKSTGQLPESVTIP